MRRSHFFFYLLSAILLLAGCGRPAAQPNPTVPSRAAPAEETDARVSNRPGNEHGGVIIVEYHKIAKQEARWDRSIVRFREDLARFHRLGFRPVTLEGYLNGQMNLPPGASPVVFTFDDSHPSQFRLLEDGSLDPECAVGIWQDFVKEHPDFPIRATFFVLPSTGPWGQSALATRKFELLKEWGCEVGSHTLSHINLKKADTQKAEKELEGAASYIKSKGFDPFAIALPFGISPRDPNILKKYHRAALLVGAGPAPAPGSQELNPWRLPRIQGIDGEMGITYWLDQVENGRFKPYVQP